MSESPVCGDPRPAIRPSVRDVVVDRSLDCDPVPSVIDVVVKFPFVAVDPEAIIALPAIYRAVKVVIDPFFAGFSFLGTYRSTLLFRTGSFIHT